MPERYYHALEFVPRKSDPNRRWALSVKQPLAALVARGITPLVIKSKLPPPEMMGKRIALHAGAGDVPYKDFSEHAASWTKVIWGVELSDLRLALPKSAIIATVKLEAAFRVKRVADARAYAHRGNAYSAPFGGLWERHDTRPVFEMGPIEGRYAWALTEPKLCARPVPLKGMGGLFDLALALEGQGKSRPPEFDPQTPDASRDGADGSGSRLESRSDPVSAQSASHGSGSRLESPSASGPSAHEAGSRLRSQSPHEQGDGAAAPANAGNSGEQTAASGSIQNKEGA